MVAPPESLPARLYLLSYDTERQKLTGGQQRGMLLRAAALAELLLAGYLADARGKAELVPGRPAPQDPVLAELLGEIAESRPRSWQHWISRHHRQTVQAVQHQLEHARLLRLEPRRILGLFPVTKVTVRDTRAVKQLGRSARSALQGTQPLTRVEDRDAAALSLAAAAGLRTVVSRAEAREQKHRIEELAQRIDPLPKQLRKAIQAQQAASSAGAAGG